jgi:hypothetical protein
MGYVRFKIPNYFVAIRFDIKLKKREGTTVYGVCNKVGSQYVVFLDYDYNDMLFIEREINDLQKRFNIGTAYVFTTKKGMHVYFLDVMTYEECKEIIFASSCDKHYKTIATNNNVRSWVLRCSSKQDNNIEFLKTIHRISTRKKSKPHMNYLLSLGIPRELFNSMTYDQKTFDNKLIYTCYEA